MDTTPATHVVVTTCRKVVGLDPNGVVKLLGDTHHHHLSAAIGCHLHACRLVAQ